MKQKKPLRPHSTHRFQSVASVPNLKRRLGSLIRQPIFIFITFWGHATILSGTLLFFYFEKEANPKVTSLFDSFYWAVATVTTVGDSNLTPTTIGGKIVSMGMMILGCLFLWSYAALFAGGLVVPEIRRIEEEVLELEDEVMGTERTKAKKTHF